MQKYTPEQMAMITQRFVEFIDTHDPAQVSRNLRNILLDYIAYQADEGLPVDFRQQLWGLQDLMNLMDVTLAKQYRMEVHHFYSSEQVERLTIKGKDRNSLEKHIRIYRQ